jgi:peptidoglycan/LPS O-acetylase OafA/YrhL
MYIQPKRIEFLDSIRGLAAVFVLLYHSVSFQFPSGVFYFINLPIINIFFDGGAAVAMFFVLSGFVLSRPYLLPPKNGEAARKIFLPTFYLRRFTRIWIPWFFVFCLCGFVAKYLLREYETIPAYSWAERAREWHLPLTLISALRQVTLMNFSDPNSPHLVSADWSLGVELRASLLIPLFVFFSKGKRAITLPIIAVLLFVLSSHGYYVSFVLGVALARGCDWMAALVHSFPRYAQWMLLALGILFYESRHMAINLIHLPESTGGYFWCLNSVGCVIILVICLSNIGIQKILNHGILVFLGRISYSVYLLQFIAIFCLQPLTVHTLNSMGITQTAVLLPICLAVSLFPTIALAAVTYRFVEIPAIEFGHRMTKLIQKRFLKS